MEPEIQGYHWEHNWPDSLFSEAPIFSASLMNPQLGLISHSALVYDQWRIMDCVPSLLSLLFKLHDEVDLSAPGVRLLGWCWQWCMTNDQLISWLGSSARLPTLPILLPFRHKTIDQSLSSTNYVGPPHCTTFPRWRQHHQPQCQLSGQNSEPEIPLHT